MRSALLSLILCLGFYSLKAQTYKVTMVTTQGTIRLYLYDNTPKHRDNMVKLIKQKFYDSTLFHRVIPEFMIQGGDPDSKRAVAEQNLGEGDVGYRVDAEINETNYHKRGVLAAARDNNPQKASSGCQFYITVGKKFTDAELDNISKRTGRTFSPAQRQVYKTIGGTPHLDGNYTVYGEVTEGMDVVDRIVKQARNASDRPKEDQRMIRVTVKKKKKFLLF